VTLALLNLTHIVVVRRIVRSQPRSRMALYDLWLQILLDLALLTVVVHHVGSLESYAPLMYLFHIVLACIFFPVAQSLFVTLAAMAMYLGCVLFETTAGTAQCILDPSVLPDRRILPAAAFWGTLASVLFIFGTIWYLASRLAGQLRQRDDELAAINCRLVAATEERAGYMLRTTHQLKAPFAAIHANTQLLLGGFCGPIPPEAATVVEQIAARCELLSRGIKAMLQLSNLRSAAQAAPAAVPMDMAALIRSCIAVWKPQMLKRCITVEEDLAPATVRAVPDHAAMILDNVLGNAINYSHDRQRVSVSCRPRPDGGARVVIRDQGIGIPADKLPRIFDDYFRTREAVAHNKVSTGLGLAIVRQTALAGRIGVRVESALGCGTALTLDFPADPPPTAGDLSQKEYAWPTS
jgi:signal transduction histidine kinase